MMHSQPTTTTAFDTRNAGAYDIKSQENQDLIRKIRDEAEGILGISEKIQFLLKQVYLHSSILLPFIRNDIGDIISNAPAQEISHVIQGQMDDISILGIPFLRELSGLENISNETKELISNKIVKDMAEEMFLSQRQPGD
ncbi:hypothetical protein HON22_01680 [Candidatus Peregrinibacteria bacterium]|jgi:hypothetical protein|nr:hypothetical protein [Candidatus Peregrinibacteria bacterium]